MRAKKKRSNTVRNASIVVAVITLLIIGLAASYKSEQKKPPQEAEEYFEIFGAAYFPRTGNKSMIEVLTLGFNIRAVKGDAHNVQVQCHSSDWYIAGTGTILKGEYAAVELQLYPSLKLPVVDEFPVEISVVSDEAEGTITIILQKE